MAIEILMPALSPTMEEGTLAKWLVKEGDEVQSGDVIAEIETDKATMEFEAVDEGIMGPLLVAEGSEGVKVNTAIAILLEDGHDAGAVPAAAAATPAPAPEAAETTTASAPAPAAPAAPRAASGDRVFASPLARRIAADKGIDLTALTGTGPKGRIIKADVLSATASTAPAPAAASTAASAAPAATVAMPSSPGADVVARMYEGRAFDEVSLDGMRKTIAARLSEAGQLISVAGGGDTVAALNHAGAADAFSYISTAGGAFLEWMEGKELPGVAALSS